MVLRIEDSGRSSEGKGGGNPSIVRNEAMEGKGSGLDPAGCACGTEKFQ